MNLFGNSYNKPGPGVYENTPRKKGISRYFEVISRDFGSLLKAGLLAFVALLPMLLLFAFGVLTSSLLPVLAGGALGGAIFLPFYCMLHDTVLRALRDEPGYWWHTYRRVLRENFRHWLAPGAVLGLLLCMQAFSIYLQFAMRDVPLLQWTLSILGVILYVSFVTWLVPQMVLIEIDPLGMLRNAVLLMFGNGKNTLLALALQLVLWGAVILYWPLTLPVVALLALWAIPLAADLAIYKPLDAAFSIEAELKKRREKEMTDYRAGNPPAGGA